MSSDTRPAFLGNLAHRIFSRHLTSGPIGDDDFVRACDALAALPQGLAAWVGYEDGWPLLERGSILAEVIVLPFVAVHW